MIRLLKKIFRLKNCSNCGKLGNKQDLSKAGRCSECETQVSNCILCHRELLPIYDDDNHQVDGGGSVMFVFCYGSERDGTTCSGVICDSCSYVLDRSMSITCAYD